MSGEENRGGIFIYQVMSRLQIDIVFVNEQHF